MTTCNCNWNATILGLVVVLIGCTIDPPARHEYCQGVFEAHSGASELSEEEATACLPQDPFACCDYFTDGGRATAVCFSAWVPGSVVSRKPVCETFTCPLGLVRACNDGN